MTFRKWALLICTLLLLIGLFILGFLPRLANTKKIDALAKENPLPRVTITEIKRNLKPSELTLPSSALGWHTTPIWARVNGYLLRYLVDIGDVVKVGQLLAEIDTPETDEQLAQAKADLVNSIAERDIAKITSDRWQKLWERNQEAVSKQEVDQYSANLKSTDAIVLANEKNVDRITYQQQFKYIYAPFNGIITQRSVDLGSLIYGSVNGTPQELFQIVETDTIRFFVDVPQTYFTQIKEGLNAEVRILELPGKVFRGVVTRYAKGLDPTARTMLTQVDVENKEGLLYAGLYGRLKFFLFHDQMNFIIPTTAIIILTGPPQVAVLDNDNVVTLREVQIGRDYGNQMEITSGLKENERIVTIPTDKIQNGVKVEIIQDTAP